MGLVLQIILAALMVVIAIRLWPAVKHHQQHGPKGTKQEWLNFAILMLGVAAFVILLIMMVKK